MKRLRIILIMAVLAATASVAFAKGAVMRISSTEFSGGKPIPSKYSCEGNDVSPPVAFTGIPSGTKTLALVADDPDAPAGLWVHWVVWNIPPETPELKEGAVPPGMQGRNGWGKNAYGGPCPPSGMHRYFFTLYALDKALDLPASTDAAGLREAMKGHVLSEAKLLGTYSKKGK
jgi:Raf kinase inhibitor-like YbhB/YbcL family protein